MRKDLRKEIILASLLGMPLGLSDYIFIPWYWNPHMLFNLKPGIESFIFAFAIGGIALLRRYFGHLLLDLSGRQYMKI